jgi:hypothetical protein
MDGPDAACKGVGDSFLRTVCSALDRRFPIVVGDPVNPTTIGNRLSNAEQTVRRKESPTPLQAASGPDLREQDRDVCSIADRPGRDGIQSMYQQPYTVNEFARTTAALASGFAKLGEQLAERGEFRPGRSAIEHTSRSCSRRSDQDMS